MRYRLLNDWILEIYDGSDWNACVCPFKSIDCDANCSLFEYPAINICNDKPMPNIVQLYCGAQLRQIVVEKEDK